MLQSPFQVGVHVIKAVVFSQVNQHSCGAATVSGPTEAAVADPSAWRALPLLPEAIKSVRLAQHKNVIKCENNLLGAHRIQQSVSDLLSVAVTQTGATELAPHSHALWITAVCFGVDCFLAALVASGSLMVRERFLSSV